MPVSRLLALAALSVATLLPHAASQTRNVKIEIDCYHSDLDHEDTSDRILVEFWNGSQRVGAKSRNGIQCSWIGSDPSFSLNTSEPVSQISLTTSGSNAFFVDELRIYDGSRLVEHHGRENGGGWCLSTDPSDEDGNWDDRVDSCDRTLWFDANIGRATEPVGVGRSCSLFNQCPDGLNCQPGRQQCYNVPRRAGQPCSAGYGCGDGLYCLAGAHVCAPTPIDRNSTRSCSSYQSPYLTALARGLGGAMSYGTGTTVGAVGVGSLEVGTVYGASSEFGCYAAVCAGSQSDVSVSTYFTIGTWTDWSAFAGQSLVISQGVSTPLFEGGYTTSQVLDTQGNLVGSVGGFSIGLGGNPVQLAGMTCCTAVLDGRQPVNALNSSINDCRRQIEESIGR